MSLIIDRIINEQGNVAIAVDGYVPININILDCMNLPPLYWRVGNGNKSLLELAVLPENGLLSSVTLVMIESGAVHKKDSMSKYFINSSHGLPVVNTDIWKNSGNHDFNQRFIDDFSLDIQVIISSESILIVIGEDRDVVSWIKCSDRFSLGIDDGKNIVNLFLDKLTQKEIGGFFEAVG